MSLKSYISLMRLDKPTGIYLLLWPTLTALFIAGNGYPSIKNIIIFILGVIVTRSAGCVINDYNDRNFDRHVKRTESRPLTTGEISPNKALLLFCLLLLIALLLVLQTNSLTIMLSIPAVILMTVYPLVKRFSNAPQFVLGLAFSSAIPMAFAAETVNVPLGAIWLVLATIFWAVAYDTMYAMVDKEYDLKIGVKSTAILFGSQVIWWISFFQILMFGSLVLLGWSFNLSWIYYLGILFAIFFAIYHSTLLRSDDKNMCFKAFLQNHWLGFVIFIATVTSFYVRF